jgi:hypothetical protein
MFDRNRKQVEAKKLNIFSTALTNRKNSTGLAIQHDHYRFTAKSSSSLNSKTFSQKEGKVRARVAGERTWVDGSSGHRYTYVPGQFTQREAWGVARSRGGGAVVFNTMDEWQRVMQAFDYRTIAYAHTGHYQLPTGREPGLGWVTRTREPSAPLNQLFNSDGPDDGVRNKWGWRPIDGGFEVYYGPSQGKNEDAGVIWHDNGGRLEDVSVNARGGVLIEFRR